MKNAKKRERPQWHADFKEKTGRYPNRFEVFMRTAGRNLERKEDFEELGIADCDYCGEESGDLLLDGEGNLACPKCR